MDDSNDSFLTGNLTNESLPATLGDVEKSPTTVEGAENLTATNADAENPTTTDLKALEKNDPQRVYLVTYSNANLNKFPTRKAFAYAVVMEFGGANVSYFACSKELHQSGESHYHLALKLSKSCRWGGVKNRLQQKHGIVVNFMESPDGGMYSRVHRYISKEDAEVYQGSVLEKHPNLECLRAESSGELPKQMKRTGRRGRQPENRRHPLLRRRSRKNQRESTNTTW